MYQRISRDRFVKLDRLSDLPRDIWFLLAVYFFASSAHFVHNAAYISYYPKMPSLSRASVAWRRAMRPSHMT